MCSRRRPARYGDPHIVDETLEQIDLDTIGAGDVIGIGIHTLNCLRGYEVGRAARDARGARGYGGIHATLYPDEPFEHGGATPSSRATAIACGRGDCDIAAGGRSACMRAARSKAAR